MVATLCESRLAPPIPQDLIIRALTICDKKQIDMYGEPPYGCFEIEKFFYYLLSPEFLGEFVKLYSPQYHGRTYSKFFSEALYDFQSGNSDPIVELLTKI